MVRINTSDAGGKRLALLKSLANARKSCSPPPSHTCPWCLRLCLIAGMVRLGFPMCKSAGNRKATTC